MTIDDGWVVYLVRCRDGSLYCGMTLDLEGRIEAHNRGRASRCTRARLPVRLVASTLPVPRGLAARLEYHIKQLPKASKCPMLKLFREMQETGR